MLATDPLTGHRLTWLTEREDRQKLATFCAHHQTAARAFKSVEIPENLTRDWLRVEAQGQLGSCQGNGLTTSAEVLYQVATGGEVVQLSRLKAYIDTQQVDNLLGADNGSTISGGLAVATTQGFALETACPYSEVYPDKSRRQQILAIPGEDRFRIKSGFRVESHEHGLQCLAGGMTITIGTIWPFEIASGWIVQRWSPDSRGGGHARSVCEIRNRRLTEVNSWGANWGRNGRFSWDPSAFDAMLRHPDTVCLALCDLAVPRPRRVDFAARLFK